MTTSFSLNPSQQAIVAALANAGSLTRRAVCHRTKRSWAAISKATSQLREQGLVAEFEEIGEAKRGRKPGYMRLNPNVHLVGVSVTPRQFMIVVTGLDGAIKSMTTHAIAAGDDPAAAMLPHLREAIGRPHPVPAIGIAFPGHVAPDKRTVVNSIHFGGYLGRPLAEEIRAGVGRQLPVLIERNAVCALTSLQVRRRLDGDTLLVSLVTGVSAAVYIDGQILHGRGGNIGEMGHLPSGSGENLLCRCGKRACIETEIGGLAWNRKWQETCPDEARQTSFRNAVRDGHPIAVKLLTSSLAALFPTLANLIILLRPEQLALTANLPASAQAIVAKAIAPLFAANGVTSPPELIFMPDEEGHTALGAAGLGLLYLGGTQCYTGR